MMAETERIAAALEPELRRVIDMTMDRVAEIEKETMREARELMVSAGQDSQEAVDRSSRLVHNLDALSGTVSEVTSALRTEVDYVTESLRGLHGLNVKLPEEMAGNASDAESQQAEPQPVAPQASPEPEPEPEPASDRAPEAPAPDATAPEAPAPTPRTPDAPNPTPLNPTPQQLSLQRPTLRSSPAPS